jgi:hypothetical protein
MNKKIDVVGNSHPRNTNNSSSLHDYETLMRRRQQLGRKRIHQLQIISESIDYHTESLMGAYEMAQFQRDISDRSGILGEIVRSSRRPIEEMIRRPDDLDTGFPLLSATFDSEESFERLLGNIDEILELSRAEIVLGPWVLLTTPSIPTVEAVSRGPPLRDREEMTMTTAAVAAPAAATTAATAAVVAKQPVRPPIEVTKTVLSTKPKYDEYVKVIKHLTAGGIAGAVSRTSVSPLERMKILFQVQGPGMASYQGIIPSFLKITREEGVRGYFKGNGTNIIRIVPYSAIQFASYERYKSVSQSPISGRDLLMCCSVGWLVGWLIG